MEIRRKSWNVNTKEKHIKSIRIYLINRIRGCIIKIVVVIFLAVTSIISS